MSATPAKVIGVCPVVETPFDTEGAVDFESFGRLLDRLYDAGVRNIMYPGYASEFYKLSDAEREALTLDAIERFGSKPDTTVVISVPDHSTRIAVARAKFAAAHGADLINILPPHQSGPSAADIQGHVRAILQAIAPTPAILQYAPAQTGVALSPQVIAAMRIESPNLVQIKVESAPPGQLISALEAESPSLECVVGHAGVQLIDALRRGAVGVQPGCSFAEIYLAVWDLWSSGKHDEAIALHARLLPYISYWMNSVELIIAAEKHISMRRGLISTPHCRLPARVLDTEELTMIERFLGEFSELLGTR